MDCSFLFLYGSLFLFNIKQFTENVLCVDFSSETVVRSFSLIRYVNLP